MTTGGPSTTGDPNTTPSSTTSGPNTTGFTRSSRETRSSRGTRPPGTDGPSTTGGPNTTGFTRSSRETRSSRGTRSPGTTGPVTTDGATSTPAPPTTSNPFTTSSQFSTSRTTRMSTTSTRATTSQPDPVSCQVPAGHGSCVDISEYCNFKATETTDGLNEDSKATVICRQHYRFNIEYPKDPFIYGQTSTYAYCRCNNGQCNWVFNKGNVQCTHCPRETLQARHGKKQKFIEWDTGIAIYYSIVVDIRATEGWHVALDFNGALEGVANSDVKLVGAGNLDLTAVSRNNRVWTFTPNWDGLDVSNWEKNPKINLLAYFENLNDDCIEKAKKASLLFFRYPMPNDSASCLVDRFTDYPL